MLTLIKMQVMTTTEITSIQNFMLRTCMDKFATSPCLCVTETW